MRNISKWAEELRKTLRESQELTEYVQDLPPDRVESELRRLGQLITEVELGLTLLREIDPNEPATAVSGLLSGYRFPVNCLRNEDNWNKVKKARFYLIRRKGQQWEKSLNEYLKLPEILRIFALNAPDNIPELIPSSIYSRRYQLYCQTLSISPQHPLRKVELATAGHWYAKILHKGDSPVEIPINIPAGYDNLAPNPLTSFQRTRQPQNTPKTISLEDLVQTSQEMDKKLNGNADQEQSYYTRLAKIIFRIYDQEKEDFLQQNELYIDKLLHIVGLLNVGKSTLLEILTYYLAKQGYRCSLIVNDVVTSVRLAVLFAHRFGIAAAPILGNNRAEHLEKVYKPLLETSREPKNQQSLAWRWFSPVCPLLALVKSEEKWSFGWEPCHSLYQKKSPSKTVKESNEDEIEELEDQIEKKTRTCPFYYQCPRHQLEKDIAEAQIWILTPASLINSSVPRQGFDKKLTWAEMVYFESDFLFIDEADRVQVQLDSLFAPNETLVDASGTSFLNKMGLSFARSTYNSDRRNMAAILYSKAKKAQDFAQIATDIALPRLHNQPELVHWIGNNPFTGRSLFAHIIRDLLGDSPPIRPKTRKEKQKKVLEGLLSLKEREQRQKLMETLEGFFKDPLNPEQGGELAELAHYLLSIEDQKKSLALVQDWLEKWLKSTGIKPKTDDIKPITSHLHFAIIITILGDRLGFLVDHLTELMHTKMIDLHDIGEMLVHRPPRDFLAVIPSSPVGNILGFHYLNNKKEKGGKLEYFRYVGIGRYLLLNFPTLWDVDNWEGPHTVLISGTSYAPGTPAYHLKKYPTILLEPTKDNDTGRNAGISESEFFFTPQQLNGKPIALSGLERNLRKKSADDMAKALCQKVGKVQSFLEECFKQLEEKAKENPEQWKDRQRILMITNSYDETEWFAELLKSQYPVEKIDEIAFLRRDHAPSHPQGIHRGEIQDLVKRSTKIVIAPLMALERGHNILNDAKIAAFGMGLFLSRPMPVPDDWQITVQQLNDWGLSTAENPDLFSSLTLNQAYQQFYQLAVKKMLELNCRGMSFKQLTDEERSVLCWTQLVSIWQIIGRLVRGGVPCCVHFIDAKFAPNSAQFEADTEKTSLLIGMIKVLEEQAKNTTKGEKTLLEALYGPVLKALKSTERLLSNEL